jgi:hypothetical protein
MMTDEFDRQNTQCPVCHQYGSGLEWLHHLNNCLQTSDKPADASICGLTLTPELPLPAATEAVAASPNEPVPDAVVWAICPHIRRWSDPHWSEYASVHRKCDRCSESETIDGHELVCPWRFDAENAAKAVMTEVEALAGKNHASGRK